MNIDLKALSDEEVARLLAAAAAEIAARLSSRPAVVAAAPLPAPGPPIAPTGPAAPGDDDKDFALRIAARLRRGDYIKSLERQRIAEIAEKYPAWIRAQRLPTTASGGEWQRKREYYSVAPAPERR